MQQGICSMWIRAIRWECLSIFIVSCHIVILFKLLFITLYSLKNKNVGQDT